VPAGTDNIDNLLKVDRYITGQTIESIIGMIGMRTLLKKRIQGELQHMRGELQDKRDHVHRQQGRQHGEAQVRP